MGKYALTALPGTNPGTHEGKQLPLCGDAAAAHLAPVRLYVRYQGTELFVNKVRWKLTTITPDVVVAQKPEDARVELWLGKHDGKLVATVVYTEGDSAQPTCMSGRAYAPRLVP